MVTYTRTYAQIRSLAQIPSFAWLHHTWRWLLFGQRSILCPCGYPHDSHQVYPKNINYLKTWTWKLRSCSNTMILNLVFLLSWISGNDSWYLLSSSNLLLKTSCSAWSCKTLKTCGIFLCLTLYPIAQHSKQKHENRSIISIKITFQTFRNLNVNLSKDLKRNFAWKPKKSWFILTFFFVMIT